MLTRTIEGAMALARYEILKDDGTYYGEIPECRGVYANGATLEACRTALAETLEDWVLFRIHKHLLLPKIGGKSLTTPLAEDARDVRRARAALAHYRKTGQGISLDALKRESRRG